MSEAFDPYRKWLGIPAAEQPPNHYRLLAIGLFEDDPDVIETAADQRMGHLRLFQTGQHSALSQKLLNEISSAKLCLLSPQKKSEYDAGLRHQFDAARATQQSRPGPQPPRAAARPVPSGEQPRPANVIPLQDDASPVVVTQHPTPQRAARHGRRRANLWPVAGMVALATAVFVGYLIYMKPARKPPARVARNQREVAQPGKSVGTEKPSPKPSPKPSASKQPLPSETRSPKPPPPESPSPTPQRELPSPKPGGGENPPIDGIAATEPQSASSESRAAASSEATTPAPASSPTSSKEAIRPPLPPVTPPVPAAPANDKKPLDSGHVAQKLTAQEAFSLKQHTAAVTRVAFHRTLPLLASAGKDGRVLLWNLDTRAAGELHKFREEVWAVKFSPAGTMLAFANRHWWGSKLLFKTVAGLQVNEIKDFKNGGGAVASIAYSPDGRLFAAGQDDGTIRLWDVDQLREISPVAFGDRHNIYSLAFGPAAVDRKQKRTQYLLAAGCQDGEVRTLEATLGRNKINDGWTFRPTSVQFPKAGAILGVRFSHDGTFLGLTRAGGQVAICNPQNGQSLRELASGGRGAGSAEGIAFHPHLPWCVTAHKDSRVARVWNATSAELLCELPGHEGGVMCAEFSPDGRRIATASEDLSIKVWDLAGPGVPAAPKRGKKTKLAAINVGN